MTDKRDLTDAQLARMRDAGELVCQCTGRRSLVRTLFGTFECARCGRKVEHVDDDEAQ